MRSTKRSFVSMLMMMAFVLCVAGFVASSPVASADPAGMAPSGTHVYACNDGTTLTVTAGSSPTMAISYVSSGNGSGSMTWSAATGRYTQAGGWMRFAVGGDGKWHVFFMKGHYTEGAELIDSPM
jgi:hypothetical protein